MNAAPHFAHGQRGGMQTEAVSVDFRGESKAENLLKLLIGNAVPESETLAVIVPSSNRVRIRKRCSARSVIPIASMAFFHQIIENLQ